MIEVDPKSQSHKTFLCTTILDALGSSRDDPLIKSFCATFLHHLVDQDAKVKEE